MSCEASSSQLLEDLEEALPAPRHPPHHQHQQVQQVEDPNGQTHWDFLHEEMAQAAQAPSCQAPETSSQPAGPQTSICELASWQNERFFHFEKKPKKSFQTLGPCQSPLHLIWLLIDRYPEAQLPFSEEDLHEKPHCNDSGTEIS